MKKFIAAIICLALIFSFAACSADKGSADNNTGDVMSLTSISDIVKLATDSNSAGWDDNKYIYAFTIGEKSYRAVAEINADIGSKIGELDFMDEQYNEKFADILKDAKLVEIKDISDGMMPQADLDKFVGKTGKDLLDAGFESGSSYFINEDQIEIKLANGFYEYTVQFAGEVTSEALDEDFDAAIADLTVKSITYSNISDKVTDLD